MDRGLHQFEFILSQGLKRDDSFLDIGCGPAYDFRCARHVVNYLDVGRYIGIDRLPVNDAGMVHHPKKPVFIQNESFLFPNVQIDFAWAHSLFTHINTDQIKTCLENLRPILRGRFFATFNRAFNDKTGVIGKHKTYRSTRYLLMTIQKLAAEAGYKLTYVGDWGHWSDQKMLLFE